MANSRTEACNIQGKLDIFIVPGNMERLKNTLNKQNLHIYENMQKVLMKELLPGNAETI